MPPRRPISAGLAGEAARAVPQVIDENAPIFVISVAAQLSGMHPQTLRSYDRMGLVSPRRSRGRSRRYSRRDIAQLRLIQHLSQEEGINLEGIRRILTLESEVTALRRQVSELQHLITTAAVTSRVFTADPIGGVHLGRSAHRSWTAPKALPRR